MKKEFYKATIIFIVFLMGFYLFVVYKRRSEERIGTIAANNIYMDNNINTQNYLGSDNPKYKNIFYISYKNDKNYTQMTFNKNRTRVTIPLVFVYHTNTQIPNETKTYTFQLVSSRDDCTDSLCIYL